jgi:hypothetical protein
MSDKTKVPGDEYLKLLRHALESGYRGLLKAEQIAESTADREWREDLRALRLTLTMSVKAHLAGIDRDWNLRTPAPKITPEAVAAAYSGSKHKNVTAVAKKMKVSRQNLSDWLRDHPAHDFRKK